ncbi:hypothetical protein [Bandra megavirus]|uniref:Uncharacterized protein n=1 Tax=Bandra megavirus TaxID=2071566 RepID=A0A2K9V7I7_9VIRU|nr:hypothetical protein [Bandra megavirus]
MSQFDATKLLKNYRTKKINFEPYLKCSKLKKYKHISKKNFDKLQPNKTYIKYIKNEDLYQDKNYDKHIRCGGILINSGYFIHDKFYASDNTDKWTHLLLKFVPFPTIIETENGIDKINEYENHIFTIKISNYHLFYRFFNKN